MGNAYHCLLVPSMSLYGRGGRGIEASHRAHGRAERTELDGQLSLAPYNNNNNQFLVPGSDAWWINDGGLLYYCVQFLKAAFFF